jgi:alkaline phosphatase
VPVFAFGPGAAQFAGVFDTTRLAPRIAGLLGLEPLTRLADPMQN